MNTESAIASPTTEEGYYQNIGVIKGRIRKHNQSKGKHLYTLVYDGREYLIKYPRNFKPGAAFFRENDLYYLVYPLPQQKKAYSLLKADYGIERREALKKVEQGIIDLYMKDSWGKQFMEENTRELFRELPHLFDGSPKDKAKQNSLAASSVFRLLQAALFPTNKEISRKGRRIAQETLIWLNECLCHQLFHPDIEDPFFSFLEERINQRYQSIETERRANKVMFNTMRFRIVGFSGDPNVNPYELEDGHFNVSGEWKIREKRPEQAHFTWYMNKVKREKDFIADPEDMKRKIMSVRSGKKGVPIDFDLEKFYAKATCQFKTKTNSFKLLSDLEKFTGICPPLVKSQKKKLFEEKTVGEQSTVEKKKVILPKRRLGK